jgi:tetratricopeptide (TPR) repeat protein
MSAEGPHPQLLRGLQLKQLGRYADAESAFKEALAQEPNDAFALHHLAGCRWQMPERRRDALQTIDEAIAIEPNDADHHILRAFILCSLDRPKDALATARTALGLAPNDSRAFTAEAQAYLQMEDWALAEQSARQALSLDADNTSAANQLAQALRLQNKLDETDAHLAGMLARDPNDAFTHSNAGWAALHRGDRHSAENHFREALRIDPDFEHAREGLLTSFRARSPLYRGYLRYCFAMARLSRKARWAVILGLYFGVRVARALPYGSVVVALYFLFVLWVWVARPVGNAFLLFDSFARYALRKWEKLEAAVVAGCLVVGLAGLIASFAVQSEAFLFIGIGGIAAAFPLSLTFTNQARLGRWIFGGIGALGLVATALITISSVTPILPVEPLADFFIGTCVACAATTWLGNVRALYQRG